MREQRDICVGIATPHPIFRAGLKRLLDSEGGFRIQGEAANADEAVNLLKDLRLDVLLLDVSVPRLIGLEALQHLQKKPPGLRTILLTECSEKSVIIDGLLHGAYGVVPKQASCQILFKSIRTVMTGQLWVSRDVIFHLVEILSQRNCASIDKSKTFGLTPRELEISVLVANGHDNKQIAQMVRISLSTVKHHLTRIFDKVGVSNRLELATFAVNQNLL